VIYNGVHYDVLAVSASPKADPDDDVTEFNPRTKRGKMILAAAQQLVSLAPPAWSCQPRLLLSYYCSVKREQLCCPVSLPCHKLA